MSVTCIWMRIRMYWRTSDRRWRGRYGTCQIPERIPVSGYGSNSLDGVKKTIELPEEAQAPVAKGAEAGRAVYLLNGVEIGSVPILYENDVAKAVYKDYLFKIMEFYLL